MVLYVHMASRIKISHSDPVEELRQAVRNSKDEEQKNRIRAIIDLKEGMSGADVAKRFVVHRETIRNWILAFNEGGTDALKMSKGGRPEGRPVWDPGIFEALTKEIDKGGKYWSLPLMCEWIKKRFNKSISDSTVWYHVTHANYSFKSARPHPYQGNAEKQEAFKKGGSKQRLSH